MRSRVIGALLVIMLAGATLWACGSIRSAMRGGSPEPSWRSFESEILVAAKDLKAGDIIDSTSFVVSTIEEQRPSNCYDLVEPNRPSECSPSGVIYASDLDSVLGRTLVVDMTKEALLFESDMSPMPEE